MSVSPARHFSDRPPDAGQPALPPPTGIPWDVIFAATTDGVVIYDATGRLTWANPAALSAFGSAPAAPAVRDAAGRGVERAGLPDARALRGETVQGARFLVTGAAGMEVAVQATAAPLRAGDAITGAIVIWHEVATVESRNQHEQAQALSRRLVEAQEAERRHIARELHDEVGQALTAVKINLQAIASLCETPAAGPRLKDSIAVVERALQQVRNISLDLRPSLLDDLGLVSALRWYVDNQTQRAGLQARFSVSPPDLRLTPNLETDCFRVAQEALTNVIRHAHATRVEVSLQGTGHGARLVIRDDGVGFNVAHTLAQAARGKSLGLVGLRERVALAGGRMEIVSAHGSGTEVRAWFPNEAKA
jgi:signal transduction histidine kinase